MSDLAAALIRRRGPRDTLYAVALGEFAGAPELEVDLAAQALEALGLAEQWSSTAEFVATLRHFGADPARHVLLRGSLDVGTPEEREVSLAVMVASLCEQCLAANCGECPGATRVPPMPGTNGLAHRVLCTCAGENHPESLPETEGD